MIESHHMQSEMKNSAQLAMILTGLDERAKEKFTLKFILKSD